MDEAVLLCAQWFSPSFPVGSFAYSQGLECAIVEGAVSDPEDLVEWLEDLLDHGSGRSDAILIRCAAACGPDDLPALDAMAHAFCPGAERLREIRDTGRAFGATLTDAWGVAERDLCYAVAVGRACRKFDVPVDFAVPQYLLAVVTNLVAAAQRLMPLGQGRAQRIVADLHPLCRKVGEETRGCRPDDLATASFAGEIAAMRHETQHPRIFRS